ncbi:hypothetical protein RI054_02g13130 [Pseudoscourfieldia marina]
MMLLAVVATNRRQSLPPRRVGTLPSLDARSNPARDWRRHVYAARDALLRGTPLATAAPSSSLKVPAESELARERRRRIVAATDVVLELDAPSLCRALGIARARLVADLPLAARMMMNHVICWSAGYIKQSFDSFRRLRRFAGSSPMDGMTVAAFLESVDSSARQGAKRKRDAPSEIPGFVRNDANGSRAAIKQLAGLRWVAAYLGVELPLDAPVLKRFCVSTADKQAAPSTAFSPRSVRSGKGIEGPESVAVRAGALRRACVPGVGVLPPDTNAASIHRSRRTFASQVDGYGAGEGPATRALAPTSLRAIRDGIDGPGYLDSIDAMLEDLDSPSFVLRDADSADGDPSSAARWKPRACTGARANASLRDCLQVACGMSKEQAAWYSSSHARHFLPLVALMRHENADRRNELGRWSGAAARSALPVEQAIADQANKAAVMPNRYATAAIPHMVIGIIEDQVEAG